MRGYGMDTINAANTTKFNSFSEVANGLTRVSKGLTIFATALILTGCTIYHAPTPKDQQEKEFRMQQLLINTSQRNSNDQLKATQEFKRTYDLDRPGVFVPPQAIPQPTPDQRPTAEGEPG